jgi:hypothetical protein
LSGYCLITSAERSWQNRWWISRFAFHGKSGLRRKPFEILRA